MYVTQMPALPPVANVFKTIHKHSIDAIDIFNIHYWQWAGTTPTDAAAEAFANACFNEWNSHVMPNLCNDLTLNEVEVIDLTSDVAATAISTEDPATGGIDSAATS